ncbi:MAG: hypothetical protein M1826_006919 [Phylliscum demangeonii]|nr:MAG: hypothetical protein M1826_006919 [Phylliscum demangeonii]
MRSIHALLVILGARWAFGLGSADTTATHPPRDDVNDPKSVDLIDVIHRPKVLALVAVAFGAGSTVAVDLFLDGLESASTAGLAGAIPVPEDCGLMDDPGLTTADAGFPEMAMDGAKGEYLTFRRGLHEGEALETAGEREAHFNGFRDMLNDRVPAQAILPVKGQGPDKYLTGYRRREV